MRLAEVHMFLPRRKHKRRVGRGPGSGHGKTSGRGGRGATARSGSNTPARYEGGQMPLFRRLPKRGFSNRRFQCRHLVVNVKDLNRFPANSTVNLPLLLEEGKISVALSKPGAGLKVLGAGELTVPLLVQAQAFSRSAREKIERAGGKAELVAWERRWPLRQD